MDRSEGIRVEGAKGRRAKRPKTRGQSVQSRDDHPIPTAGVPDEVVAEAVDVRLELAAAVVDVGDEELPPNAEEKERRPPGGVELVAALRGKLSNLPLGETEAFGVTQGAEHGPEVGVLRHLPDLDSRLLGRVALHVRAPALEVWVEPPREDVAGGCERLPTCGCTNHDGFIGVEAGEDDRFGLRCGGHFWPPFLLVFSISCPFCQLYVD